MIPTAIVILNEPSNLSLQLLWGLVNIQVHPLLATSVIPFNLAVCLWVIWTGQYVTQAVGFEIVAEVLADQGRATIDNKPGPIQRR